MELTFAPILIQMLQIKTWKQIREQKTLARLNVNLVPFIVIFSHDKIWKINKKQTYKPHVTGQLLPFQSAHSYRRVCKISCYHYVLLVYKSHKYLIFGKYCEFQLSKGKPKYFYYYGLCRSRLCNIFCKNIGLIVL